MERNGAMRSSKWIILFCMFLLVLGLTGCGGKERREIKKEITSEFGRLKDLDSDTFQEYLALENLFPDASTSQASAGLIEEVTSQFFKDFDYKILKITVTGETNASCHLQVITLDAHALAKDYQKEYLSQVILSAANGQQGPDTSLEQHYTLLRDLMNGHTYQTISNSCDIYLIKEGEKWRIRKTPDLENQLVGGFISAIANPYLLSPTETVGVYFDTLKAMDAPQMCTYLGLTDVFRSSGTDSQALAQALFLQMRACLDYRVTGAQDNGSMATVNMEITSFSCKEILSTYQKALDEYLDTTDALIDGPTGRLAKSNTFLLDAIKNNTATASQTVSLPLINDGVSWKLKSNTQIGKALFGDFSMDTVTSSLSDDNDKD